ncbi:gluconate:H+ symporter [Chryseolinea lacunae]|uniref:Gluconate transporter n=1 Tax=Chryseolinea lacunae TaxID=2801331 RepID=A0ABS1KZ68_9BACT|nr:gluconate:H+ symporter [Chryseolinea lacunae]MBL0744749.1 gluconate transporter [Chryseolinea lacunae]
MSILIILFCIGLLVLLITKLKLNAFLAFLLIAILAGLLLGIEPAKITGSIQKGMGDMLGSLIIVVACGAMLGKLTADSGAAQQIASGLMKLFGERYIQWALMITGFIIGIPLFYNVGFVLVIPLIFSVAAKYKLPVVYVGLPMLAALSVTHGFLPPHPSPAALVAAFHADMGKTLMYGVLIAIPTVILAGPVFSRTLKKIKAPMLQTFKSEALPDDQLPSLSISIFSSLLPVILLALTTFLGGAVKEAGPLKTFISFISDPAIVMILALAVATYTLGLRMHMGMKRIMDIYGDAVKDIAMLLLIMGGAGSLKQILLDSGVSAEIGQILNGLDVHPLVLGWAMACLIRVCVGSATVAGLTAVGIIMPVMSRPDVNPNLMVLSIGAGSLMFSHVNDAGFWLFKEYFGLSIKDTIRSWSLMETIVAIAGLGGVMVLNAFVS